MTYAGACMATVESPWDSQQPPRKSPLYLRILGVIFNILLNMVGYTALGGSLPMAGFLCHLRLYFDSGLYVHKGIVDYSNCL